MKYLLIFLAAVILPNLSQAQWDSLNSGTTVNLQDIFFKDASNGFCVGGGGQEGYPNPNEKGTILRTTDGGLHWEKIFEDSVLGINKVIANETTILAFGRSSTTTYMLQSLDDGSTWAIYPINFYPLSATQSVKCDGNKIYVLTESSNIKKFESGQWQSITNNDVVGQVFDINTQSIYLANGSPHYLIKSNDNGLTWDSFPISTPDPLSPSAYTGALIDVFNDTIILSTTYPNILAYSFDGGDTWDDYLLNYITIGFIASPKVMIGMKGNTIVRSINGGQTFINQDTLPYNISTFYFVNENLGFVCGKNGMIYKTTNGGGLPTNIKETGTLKKKLKIFPNPAKSNIRLQYNNLHIQGLQLVDLSGRSIKNFPVESRMLDISGIAEGVYFLKVKAKEGEMTKQVVVTGQ